MPQIDYKTPATRSAQELSATLRKWENWIIIGLVCIPVGMVIIFIYLVLFGGDSNF